MDLLEFNVELNIPVSNSLEIDDTNLKPQEKILPLIKCGEVFTSENENNYFTFLCTFCGTLLPNIQLFESHIKIYHTGKSTIEENQNSVDKQKMEIASTSSNCIILGEQYLESSSNLLTQQTEFIENILESERTSPNFLIEQTEFKEVQMQTEFTEEQIHTQFIDEKLESEESLLNLLSEQIEKVEENLEIENVSVETKQIQTKKHSKKIQKKKRKKNEKILWPCKMCTQKFNSEVLLNSHMKYDHVYTDVILQSNQLENENGELIELDPFKCRFCKRQFKRRALRYEHECLHTGEKPFNCTQCNKKFRTKSQLREHAELHYDLTFNCNLCDATFKKKKSLKDHIRRHDNNRSFKCDYCDKCFLNNGTKKTHENVHKGNIRFVCSICGESFYTDSNLIVHTRRKHTGEKPFKCKYCDRKFVTNSDKKEHETTHTGEKPFTCDICDKKFSLSKYLKDHMKLHFDVLRYICHICGKGFKQSTMLRHHRKTHGIPLKNNI